MQISGGNISDVCGITVLNITNTLFHTHFPPKQTICIMRRVIISYVRMMVTSCHFWYFDQSKKQVFAIVMKETSLEKYYESENIYHL